VVGLGGPTPRVANEESSTVCFGLGRRYPSTGCEPLGQRHYFLDPALVCQGVNVTSQNVTQLISLTLKGQVRCTSKKGER